MNKKIFIIISAVLLLAMIPVGCSGGCGSCSPKHDYSGDVEIVKEVFDKIRTDDVHDQMAYFVSFTQKYSVESKSDSEFESDNYTLAYEGDGTVALCYDARGSVVSSTDFFDSKLVGKDLLINGVGYLTGFQHEKYTYKDEYTDKTSGGETRTEDTSKEDTRIFEIAVDDDNFYVSNTTQSQDLNNSENDTYDEFTGKIGKAVFIDPLPDEMVTDAASKLLFMDAWPYIRVVTKYSNDLFGNMDFSDDDAIYAFFEENDIRAEKTEETVRISFVMDASAIMERFLSEPSESPIKIKGTMDFDKNTGELSEYNYDVTELFAAIMNAGEEDKTEYSFKADEFTVFGKNVVSTEEKVHVYLDEIVKKEYVEYDSESRDSFFDDFVEHLLPAGE